MKKLWMLVLVLIARTAHADIVFVDVNDQAGERRAAEELGRRHGQRVHILKGQSDGGFEKEIGDLFAAAEAGRLSIDTLVVSGHSSGTSFFGKNGGANIEMFRKAGETNPKARDQVRHFIGLGCYTGTRQAGGDWTTVLPNVITLSGFDGIGPSGTWSERFFTKVYDATAAARRAAGGTDRQLGQAFGNANTLAGYKRVLASLEAVKITNSGFRLCDQFYSVKPQPSNKAMENEVADRTRAVFQRYFDATPGYEDVPVNRDANTDLRQYYVLLQRYLPLVESSWERDQLTQKRDQALRLIYFQNVKQKWAREHASEIAGTPLANVERMSRKDVLAAIGGMEGPLADAAKKELRDLDVPITWIE